MAKQGMLPFYESPSDGPKRSAQPSPENDASNSEHPFHGSDLIFAYTTDDALADGMLLDARKGPFANVTAQHHPTRIPIYLTRSLRVLIETAIDEYKWMDVAGIWHDILTCARSVGNLRLGDVRPFDVIIGSIDSPPMTLYVTLDGVCITFMCREDR